MEFPFSWHTGVNISDFKLLVKAETALFDRILGIKNPSNKEMEMILDMLTTGKTIQSSNPYNDKHLQIIVAPKVKTQLFTIDSKFLKICQNI